MDWFDIMLWLLFNSCLDFFSIKRKRLTSKSVQIVRLSCLLKTVETNI